MTLNNLSIREFTEDELKKIDAALEMLEEVFSAKVVDLFPKKKTVSKKAHQESLPQLLDIQQSSSGDQLEKLLGTRAIRLKNVTGKIIDTNLALLKSSLQSANLY